MTDATPTGVDPVPPDLQQALTEGYEAWRGKLYEEARGKLEAALSEAQAAGSLFGVLQAKHHLGNVMFNLREDAASRRLHAEVLAEGVKPGLEWCIATSLGNIANVDVVEGRLDDARAHYDAAIAAYEAAGQAPMAAQVKATRAYIDRLVAEGRLGEAFKHLRVPG